MRHVTIIPFGKLLPSAGSRPVGRGDELQVRGPASGRVVERPPYCWLASDASEIEVHGQVDEAAPRSSTWSVVGVFVAGLALLLCLSALQYVQH
jgi:hypothetical protein